MNHQINQNQFPPIEKITSPTVSTEQAAFYLNRKPQTMRKHACYETLPIKPLRIGGRLAWKVSDLKALVSGEVSA